MTALSWSRRIHFLLYQENTRKKTETETGPLGVRNKQKPVNRSALNNLKITIKVATLNPCLGLQHKKM